MWTKSSFNTQLTLFSATLDTVSNPIIPLFSNLFPLKTLFSTKRPFLAGSIQTANFKRKQLINCNNLTQKLLNFDIVKLSFWCLDQICWSLIRRLFFFENRIVFQNTCLVWLKGASWPLIPEQCSIFTAVKSIIIIKCSSAASELMCNGKRRKGTWQSSRLDCCF